MKTKRTIIPALSVLVVLGVLGSVAWESLPARAAPSEEQKVRAHQCPMHPWVKLDGPGRCTICGMDLTPIGEAEVGAADVVVLRASNVTALNVQTHEIKRRSLTRRMRVAGTLEPNESRTTIVSSPAPSRIQDVAIEFTGVEVEEGQRLITLLSPELVQKRAFLNSLGSPRSIDGKSLAYVVVGTDPFSSTLVAQQAGTVTQRNAFVGQYVAEGEKLLTIVDSSVLWFRFDVYEQQLPWFDLGQKIDVSIASIPGRIFPAVISFIEPGINEATRTVKIRADVDNPAVVINGRKQRQLRFGMYAEGVVRTDVPDALCVPRTAVLFPGGIAWVYLDRGQGAYEHRRVRLGRQGDGYWEVLQGLADGDRVVTAGNVLIDAEAQFVQGAPFADDSAETPIATAGGQLAEVVPMNNPELATQADAVMSAPTDHAAAGCDDTSIVRDRSSAVGRAPQVPAARGAIASSSAVPAPTEPVAPPARSLDSAASSACAPAAVPSGNPRIKVVNARRNVKDELWNQRLTAIAAAHGQNLDGSALEVPAGAGTTGRLEMVSVGPAILPDTQPGVELDPAQPHPVTPQPVPERRSAQAVRNNTPNPATRDGFRLALMEEIDDPRIALAVDRMESTAPETAVLSESQLLALKAFVAVADGISRSLAADDLGAFNQQAARLDSVLQSLQRELTAIHPWGQVIERLGTAAAATPAPDLATARTRFLDFGTAASELANELKRAVPAFSGLRIFHCPMAPKPGLWIQTTPPLANPYFGKAMLRCGEEVTP